MDPDTNLEEQRLLAASIIEKIDTSYDDETDSLPREVEEDVIRDANRLAELVQALDTWLVRGGFLPKEWKRP